MKKGCYIVSVLFAVGWILAFFVLRAGTSVHIFLMMAVICWLHATIAIPQKKCMLGDDLDEAKYGATKQRA
jgi:hypothetical protein